MVNRAANATIKGYFYQFDYAISQLLQAVDEHSIFTIEGIEDVDIDDVASEKYIQCKYYSATDYNHSVIKPAIAAMIIHFKTIGSKKNPPPTYKLYGHYKSGQEKLPKKSKITVDFIKTHFLTTLKKDAPTELIHELHKITDPEIRQFAKQLEINVYAASYEIQMDEIRQLLIANIPGTTPEDVENLFYPASINNIRALAIQHNLTARQTTKHRFISEINSKGQLFTSWLKQYQGVKKYIQLIRDKYFKHHSATSIENKARFFIINLPLNSLAPPNVLDLALIVSSKFSSRASARTPDSDRYCPYLHFSNMDDSKYKELKHSLRGASIIFLDGHDFKDSGFSVDSILPPPTAHKNTRLKLIDELDDLNYTLQAQHRRPIEIFEFYNDTPVSRLDIPLAALYAAIKIDSLEDIKEILK